MNKKTRHLILAVFSLILLAGTLFLQMESKNKEELARVAFGYPFSFITQDHSSNYSFSYFPTWDGFNFREWHLVQNFYPIRFLASFLSIYLALELLIFLLETLKFRKGHAEGNTEEYTEEHRKGHRKEHGEEHGEEHGKGHREEHGEEHGEGHRDEHGEGHRDEPKEEPKGDSGK
jgi:hypothetical protein